MKPIVQALAAAALSAMLPSLAVAQEYSPADDDAPGAQGAPASEWEEQYSEEAPTDVASGDTPAAPTVSPPPAAEGEAAPSGDWVWTAQYGWVWMPYADEYTRVPADGYGEPYMYVYAPAYGWSWLVAPWVWGFGPWPRFGLHGAVYFGWYHHGWWRTPARWHYAPGFHHDRFRYGGGFGHFPAPRAAPFHRGPGLRSAPPAGARFHRGWEGGPAHRGGFDGGHGSGLRPGSSGHGEAGFRGGPRSGHAFGGAGGHGFRGGRGAGGGRSFGGHAGRR